MAKQNATPAAGPPATKPAPANTRRSTRPAAASTAPPESAALARPATARPREATGLAGRFARLQTTFRETVSELRKVQWPDRLTTRNLTLVVIGMSVVLSALLGFFDALLTRLFEWLIKV